MGLPARVPDRPASTTTATTVRLRLLGTLGVDSGPGSGRTRVPEGGTRLLVLLALHRRRVDRKWAAGVLWPDGNDERAVGNLRSSIWRLRGAGLDVLEVDNYDVGLAPHVQVDVDEVDAWAARLVSDRASPTDLVVHPDCLDA